jgi:hypothetical protein
VEGELDQALEGLESLDLDELPEGDEMNFDFDFDFEEPLDESESEGECAPQEEEDDDSLSMLGSLATLAVEPGLEGEWAVLAPDAIAAPAHLAALPSAVGVVGQAMARVAGILEPLHDTDCTPAVGVQHPSAHSGSCSDHEHASACSGVSHGATSTAGHAESCDGTQVKTKAKDGKWKAEKKAHTDHDACCASGTGATVAATPRAPRAPAPPAVWTFPAPPAQGGAAWIEPPGLPSASDDDALAELRELMLEMRADVRDLRGSLEELRRELRSLPASGRAR